MSIQFVTSSVAGAQRHHKEALCIYQRAFFGYTFMVDGNNLI